MTELFKHIEEKICAGRLVRRGQGILVAVSGGLDSMVLLNVLHELAPANRWRLTVAHLNHQLRGRSSEADERLVRQTAQQLKLRVVVKRVDVRKFARAHKLSLEMAARKLRHDFLARVAARLSIPTIALAHHADDQLELFFLRLLRGSGGEGLAGMKWRGPSPSDPEVEMVRPVLDQPKSALRDYAMAKGIRFREDASNACLDIQRNRIRHELLPMLRRDYQPALDKTVLRMMEIVGAETEFVAQTARAWLENLPSLVVADVRSLTSRGRVETERRDLVRASSRRLLRGDGLHFDKLPVAVQRRALQLQLVRHGVAPNFDLVEELRLSPRRHVCLGKMSSHFDVRPHPREEKARMGGRGDIFAVRDSAGVVDLHRAESAGFEAGSLAVDLEGRAGALLFEKVRILWRVQPGKFLGLPKPQAGSEVFDADKVGSRILLRHWLPGDRFQPIGMKSAVKLQDLFTNAKTPRSRRQRLTLALTAQGDIFWVEGLRISERYKLTKSTIRRLHWRWQRL